MSEAVNKLRNAIDEANKCATVLVGAGYEVQFFSNQEDITQVCCTVKKITEERHDL